MDSILPHITLETGKLPTYSIIWLHGLGADGQDFVPVVDEIELPVAVRYIFPHAPKRPVTVNGGYVMRAWYDISGNDINAQQDEAGIRASQADIEALIAQEVERGIAPQHIFLAGFSQGGAIALHTALRQKVPLAGVLALSTYLPLAATVGTEASPDSRNTPIFMAHGRDDTVVTYQLGMSSRNELQTQGYEVTWQDYSMQHSVNAAELNDIEVWIKSRIEEKQARIKD